MISHDRAQELISARMDAPLTPAEHRELKRTSPPAMRAGSSWAVPTTWRAGCRGCRISRRARRSPARSWPRFAPRMHGWGWLRGALQTLSSPGMAVASSLALVLALAGAMFLAMNAPGRRGRHQAADAEETIAAVAVQPLPTQAPADTLVPEPTATEVPMRTISGPEATEPPVETPTPRPTETRVPIVARAERQSARPRPPWSSSNRRSNQSRAKTRRSRWRPSPKPLP